MTVRLYELALCCVLAFLWGWHSKDALTAVIGSFLISVVIQLWVKSYDK